MLIQTFQENHSDYPSFDSFWDIFIIIEQTPIHVWRDKQKNKSGTEILKKLSGFPGGQVNLASGLHAVVQIESGEKLVFRQLIKCSLCNHFPASKFKAIKFSRYNNGRQKLLTLLTYAYN